MAYPLKTYKTEKGVYEIPEKEAASFLKDFPNAMEVVSYKMGKDTFDIPVKETQVFLKENPQAVPLKKKEQSDSGLPEPSAGGLDGTTSTTEPIPTIEMYQTPTGDLTEDPFAQVKKAKELSGKTKVVSKGGIGGMGMGTTGTEIVPDEEATKEAKKIQEELKRTGYKEDFFAGISDLPEDAYNNPATSKETLSVLYKNNPVKFTQLTNEAKNKYAIRDAAAKKAYDEAQGDDKQKSDYASKVGILKGNEYSGDEIPPPENMQQFYDIVRQKQELINQSIDNPEEKKKAQERLRQTYAQAINPTSLDFREEYQNSGYADKMDVNQYAGLKTLELFEPEKAKALRSVIDAQITPQWNVNVQVTPEEQVRGIVTDSAMAEKMGGTISQLTVNQRIGKEEALRELSLLGATNEYDSIVSEQNDLKNKYKEAQTDEEKANIYAKMLLNEQRANDLQKTEAQNDERYPITAKLKMDNLVKEIVQDRGIGVGGWMYNKYAHGVGTGVDAVENLVTSIFGSEKEKTDLRMKRIGEGKQFEASIYLPESERSINSPVIIQASDELKKKAKEILNGRSLSELSADEKDKLSKLVADNQDQIKTITNPEAGKSKNFWSKATGMTIAGFTADMGSFLTKMGLMQGVGMGAKAAEATTLFMDGYEPAFNKKLAEGASVESANEYGILHGAVLSLMSKFGSKYETIKNVVKGGSSPISKYIAGLSEESWNKLAGEAKPLLSRLGKASKDIVKEQGKMIGTFGVAAPVASAVADNLFYDEGRSVKEIADEALLSAKEMAIGGIGFGLFGLAKGVMKTKATPVEKAALFEMADFPELGKMRIDEAVKNREISKEEGERKKGIIDNVSRLVEQVPEVNDKGKPLNDQQRANYLFNLAVKESQKEKAKTLPEKQAEEAKQKALVADKENQIELEALTEKQLNDRKDKLEKAISKLDEKGKPELSDKEMANAKAELEAVDNIIKSKGDTTKKEVKEEELPNLSVPIEGTDKKGVPIGEDVPAETTDTTPTLQPKESEGVSGSALKDVVEPTQQEIMDDVKNKNFTTVEYKSESEIPDVWKDKVTSSGETNGKKIFRITLPTSQFEYESKTGISKKVSEYPTERKVEAPTQYTEAATPKEEAGKPTDVVGSEKANTVNEEPKANEVPIPEKKEVITEAKPDTGVPKTGKFEEKARKIAEKIQATELPDWLKIDDANAKKSGVGAEELKKALADATIKMGKLLDKGVEFGEAVKEAVKDIVDLLGEGMRGKIEKGFEDHYKASSIEEGGKKVGVSHEKLSDLAKELGLKEPETGEYHSPEWYAERGRALLKAGADPNEVDNPNNALHDRISIARAHLEKLVKDADKIAREKGIDSPEYKEAHAKVNDYSGKVKELGTEAHRAMTSLQGERDIDTDSFTEVKKAVEDSAGKPLSKEQEAKVNELTKRNEELKKQADEAESKLIEATEKAFKEGVEEGKKLSKSDKAKKVADRLRERAKLSKPSSFSAATPASLVWDGAVEIVAKGIEAGGKIADVIEAGIKHIKDSDWYKSLSDDKKDKAEQEFREFNNDNVGSTNLEDLQARFLDKKGNKFSTSEARDIWGYAKENYLDKGVPFRDMIGKVSDDLGLSWRQVSEALTSKKTQRISDEMWKKQSDYRKSQNATKGWIEAQNKSLPFKALRKVSAAFRGVAVFGHGGIFIGTHAGMTLFNPSQWKVVIPAFIRGWKFAYGNKANYERRVEQLRNDPNYVIAQRAGLKNNPDNINTEEFQKSQKFFEKIGGEAGIKGFNAIKVLRQDLFNLHYKKLSETEKNDPESVEQIARLVNNATGATNLKLPEWVNEATFAGGMEAARWGKLTRNPARATAIAIKALITPEKATVAERVFAKVWARRVGEQLGTMAGLLIANAAIQNTLNPKNPTNLTDPDKPDYMKFKFGDLTIDPTSGMRGAAMFIYALGKIPFMDKKERRGDSPIKYAGKSIAGYTRGKLAPLYGTIADFFDQQDFNRNPMPFSDEKPAAGHHKLTWGEYAWQKAPLPVAHAAGEMYKSALDHNGGALTTKHVIDGFIAGVLSGGTGFRIGEYNAEESNHSPFTDEDKKDQTFKYFLDKGMELPNTSLSSEIVTDNKSMTKKKVSEYPKEIQDRYNQVHKEYLKKELFDVKRKGYVYTVEYLTGDGEKKVEVYMDKTPHSKKKKLDDLSKDEMAQVLSTSQSQATKLTKKKIFNQK